MKQPRTPFEAFLRNVEKLERHSYAPELNQIHLRDGQKIKTPQCTSIEEAYLFIKMKEA